MMRPFHLVAPAPLAQASEAKSSGSSNAVAIQLSQPEPNPASAGVALRMSLAAPGAVELNLYDVGGGFVRSLANGPFDSGVHEIRWDGSDGAGRRVAPGVYFVVLRAGGAIESRKVFVRR